MIHFSAYRIDVVSKRAIVIGKGRLQHQLSRRLQLHLEQFFPAWKKAGFSDGEIQLLTVQNPAEVFAIRVRASR